MILWWKGDCFPLNHIKKRSPPVDIAFRFHACFIFLKRNYFKQLILLPSLIEFIASGNIANFEARVNIFLNIKYRLKKKLLFTWYIKWVPLNLKRIFNTQQPDWIWIKTYVPCDVGTQTFIPLIIYVTCTSSYPTY